MPDIIIDLLFAAFGYLSGSVLYARIFARLFGCMDKMENTSDRNPGTANAFASGGVWCGILTLIFDLLKGAVPVLLYCHFCPDRPVLLSALVIAAPVVGHAFPWYNGFDGGKAIAVSFGCLLGLLPELVPVLSLCLFFVLFSTLIVIQPHFYRTAVSFVCALAGMLLVGADTAHSLAFALMTCVVCLRLHMSKEERKEFKVKTIWMH